MGHFWQASGWGGGAIDKGSRAVNNLGSHRQPATAVRPEGERLQWRRPVLRKIDALAAQTPPTHKGRHPSDYLLYS